jgi:hypothetical protein
VYRLDERTELRRADGRETRKVLAFNIEFETITEVMLGENRGGVKREVFADEAKIGMVVLT